MATDDVTAASERLARHIMDGRLNDETFAAWVNGRCSVWAVSRDDLLAQVEADVWIALVAAAPDDATELSEAEWRARALAKLRRQDDVGLFAALPQSLPAGLGPRVDQLRLLSTGLTSGSAVRWLRLADTAGEFLGSGPPRRD
ncbi:hypothetical protein AB0L14_11955 [Streptomyces sp. NPDC052727]|uniref:hypothetical protein n=1 Tax=Streptomyces sp. NPDC052727 TaxID=3154854 RepID=UPI003412185C